MLPSGLPERVDDSELLSRFLTSDSQFSHTMPKPSAFMPGPADSMTSVFRQGPDPLQALWETADREITSRRVRAAAVLSALDVRRATLDVVASEPPPRHADILGWRLVAGDEVATRAQRKERALQLVQACVLVRR